MILICLIRHSAVGLEIECGWHEEQEGCQTRTELFFLGRPRDCQRRPYDFNWHGLPHTIRSHHPYRVEELMINEASDTTSFK